jgi:phenylalanyl-tRNA synthetase beta chain
MNEKVLSQGTMKVSLSWLRRWLPDLTVPAADLADALSRMGLEVDSHATVGVPREHLLVGCVLDAAPHPHADRLRLCQVGVGSGKPLQIVCGATNFSAGDHVPVALPGCVLPDGTAIATSTLRGVRSEGMMCSGKELGLSADQRGLLLLDRQWAPGTPVWEIFPDGDTVFSIELTANRGDCLSHRGVAREIAARFDLPMKGEWDFPHRPFQATGGGPEIFCETERCDRFIGWRIRGVRVGESPEWLRRDLERAGMRTVNNLVDITNWVMLDRGQPLHAFDLRKIAGGELHIRRARAGETFDALNHRRYQLAEGMTVIADREKPLVIAGIMGSVAAEVDGETEDILLECAAFDAATTQTTSKKLGISSEASQRFARGVDGAAMESSICRAVALVEEICGGVADGGPRDVGSVATVEEEPIPLTGDFVREKFGMAVDDGEIETVLRRLGFAPRAAANGWSVRVPPHRRRDVTTPIDLVEEFIRLYGVDRLSGQTVISRASARCNDRGYDFQIHAADLLRSHGYSECQTYSYRSEAEVRRCCEGDGDIAPLALDNPITAEQTHLRPSNIPGLLRALDENLRNGNDVRGLFEIGHTWHPDGNQLHEAISVTWICPTDCRRADWLREPAADFHAMKAIARRVADLAAANCRDGQFSPICQSQLWQDGHAAAAETLGKRGITVRVGLLNLEFTSSLSIPGRVFAGELHITPKLLEKAETPAKFTAISPFPRVTRDLAVLIDRDLTAEYVRKSVEACIVQSLPPAVKLDDLWIFDDYAGDNLGTEKRSIALRFTLERMDRTFGDGEANEIFGKIYGNLKALANMDVRDSAAS